MVPDHEVSGEDTGDDSDENVKYPIFVEFDGAVGEGKPVRMMVDASMTVLQLKKEIEVSHDLPAEESVMESGPSDVPMEDLQTLKFYRIGHSSTVRHSRVQVRTNKEDKDNSNSPENTRTFDFRGGTLATGATVWRAKPTSEEPSPEGDNKEAEPVWQKEKDGSSSLVLDADCYLSCALDLPSNQGKLINDYTIQMDICIPTLSDISLYETSWPEPKGAAAVSVNEEGVFGVMGDFSGGEETQERIVKGEWVRVVVTCGGAWGSRTLCVYIDGKRCRTVQKSLLNQRDGRFALAKQGVVLFGPRTKRSTVLLRFLDIRRYTVTPKDVAASRYENLMFSLWKKQQEEEEKTLKSKLSLGKVLETPVPMWRDRGFFGQFCDPYVENTELEGGLIEPSVLLLTHVLGQFLSRECPPPEAAAVADPATGVAKVDFPSVACPPALKTLLSSFSPADFDALNRVLAIFLDCKQLCQEFDVRKGEACLLPFVAGVRKRLTALKPGQRILVPGGWRGEEGNHAIMYVVECTEESKDGRLFRFVVCNTGQGLHFHAASAQFPPKLKYKTCLAIGGVTEDRIVNDIFWAVLLRLMYSPSKNNKPSRLYELLLPFLTDEPLECAVADSMRDDKLEWRSPQRAGSCYFRCVLEAAHYLCRAEGLSIPQTKLVAFGVRLQQVLMLEQDLGVSKGGVRESDLRVVQIAAQQLAYAAAKLGRSSLGTQQLSEVLQLVERVKQKVEALPCLDTNSTEPPPQLDLSLLQAGPAPPQSTWLPFFDRFWKPPNTDGLAGTPSPTTEFLPIDFTQLPERVTNLREAVDAMRLVDSLCSLVDSQAKQLKNGEMLKNALLIDTFTRLLPMPLPAPQQSIWTEKMDYKTQQDISLLLWRLSMHHVTAAFNTRNRYSFVKTTKDTRTCDAVNIVTGACLVCILDVVVRARATDHPSPISEVLRTGYVGEYKGKGSRGPEPFGISLGYFASQTATLCFASPAALLARARILEYFQAQRTPTRKSIMAWEYGNSIHGPTNEFVEAICRGMGLEVDLAHKYLSGGAGWCTWGDESKWDELVFRFAEFQALRDVTFLFKTLMTTDERIGRPYVPFYQGQQHLFWEFVHSTSSYVVRGLDISDLDCTSANSPTRCQSYALPSFLTSPALVSTEDDVLHIPTLPSLAEKGETLAVGLGQRDIELLVSFLTVPYLRIPLVLSFFTSEDRIHSLQTQKLQKVLDAVLFEPGEFLLAPQDLGHLLWQTKAKERRKKRKEQLEKQRAEPEQKQLTSQPEANVKPERPTRQVDVVPTSVPTNSREMLATPYGLLLNELSRAPGGVLRPLLQLLRSALALESGGSGALPLVLYVIRVATRVDSYLAFLVDITGVRERRLAKNPSDVPPADPSLRVGVRPEQIPTLLELWRELQTVLRTDARQFLERQMALSTKDQAKEAKHDEEAQEEDAMRKELTKLADDAKEDDSPQLEEHSLDSTEQACRLHAHRLLLFREFEGLLPLTHEQKACQIASQVFLQTRYSFAAGSLLVPECEISLLLQRSRSSLVTFVHSLGRVEASALLGEVMRVATAGAADNTGAGGGVFASAVEAKVGEVGGNSESKRNEENKDTMMSSVNLSSSTWGFIAGPQNVGRFTISEANSSTTTTTATTTTTTEATKTTSTASTTTTATTKTVTSGKGRVPPPPPPLPSPVSPIATAASGGDSNDRLTAVPVDVARGVEISLQTFQMTLRAAHLEALDDVDPDCTRVLGKIAGRLQCAPIFKARHCTKVRLVGRETTVATWDADNRPCLQTNSRLYAPNALEHQEMWIVPIIEPIRLDKRLPFQQTFGAFPLFMPAAPLSPSATVARLELVHPRKGCWKEVFVYREQRCAFVFEVLSLGRLFYRSLQYVTDARYSLRDLQPTIPVDLSMEEPWPEWERFGSGTPLDATQREEMAGCGVVVARSANHPQNFSGSEERFLPSRLFFGLLPSALLREYLFWQSETDEIRGYPVQDENGKAITYSHDKEMPEPEIEDFDPFSLYEDDDDEGGADSKPKKGQYLLRVKFQEFASVAATGMPGVMAQVSRRPLTPAEMVRLHPEQKAPGENEFVPHEIHTVDDDELILIDLLHPAPNTPLYFLQQLLIRLDNISYILCWARASRDPSSPLSVDIVELPRLKLRFSTQVMNGVVRLCSLDYAGFFVSNERSDQLTRLLTGLPTSVLLTDGKGRTSILVPNICVARPQIGACPFSTELILIRRHLTWSRALESRCYVYNVHVSRSFVLTPTLGSSLYLLFMRFAHRQYDDVFQLVNACATDTNFSNEELQIFNSLRLLNDDRHPDAHACRCKLSLAVLESSMAMPWSIPEELTMYLMKLPHVSAACRLSAREERHLLVNCFVKETRSLAELTSPVSLRSLKRKFFIRCDRRLAVTSRSDLGSLSLVMVGAESDGVGVVGLRGYKQDGWLTIGPYPGLQYQAGEKVPDAGHIRVRTVGWDKRENKRIVILQGVQSTCFLQVRRCFKWGVKEAKKDKKIDFRGTTNERRATRFLLANSTAFQITDYLRNRLAFLSALKSGKREAQITTPICAATEPAPSSESEETQEDSDDEAKDERDAEEKAQPTAEEKEEKLAQARIMVQPLVHGKEDEDPQESKSEKKGGQDEKRETLPPLGSWPLYQDRSVIGAKAADWTSLVLEYSPPHTMQGTATLRCLEVFWELGESMKGLVHGLGFLFLYQLLVSAVQVSIQSVECSHTFGRLLLQLCSDRHKPGLMQSVCHILANNPSLCQRLPKFADGRQLVTEEVRGHKIGSETVAPLDVFFSELVPILNKEIAAGNVRWPAAKVANWPEIPKTINMDEWLSSYAATASSDASPASLLGLDRAHRTPVLSDSDCAVRLLHSLVAKDLENDSGIESVGELSQQSMHELATQPLSSLKLERFVGLRSPAELGQTAISTRLPFDLSHHPSAQSSAAVSLLDSLADDLKSFAAQVASQKHACLNGFLESDMIKPKSSSTHTLEVILTELQQLRESDEAYISSAIPFIVARANRVSVPEKIAEAPDGALRLHYLLMRFCGREAHVWLGYVVGCLLSSDWINLRKLNPFLSKIDLAIIERSTVALLLRANRVCHINRCVATAQGLLVDYLKLVALTAKVDPDTERDRARLVAAIAQRADRLANELTEKRHYIDIVEGKDGNTSYSYDPRYLVFEYTWELLLREKQVHMLREFMGVNSLEARMPGQTRNAGGQSRVMQLLMGAGKTSVIAPLLGAMLADGRALVIQVVPPALLEPARQVLRTTFSCMMQKRIYTFACDRATAITRTLTKKLMQAAQSRGIVVTTPTAIKSVMLKLVENLGRLEGEGANVSEPLGAVAIEAMRLESLELARLLRIFRSGRLIMDEVDLILHPLRSELNFPIGRKVPLDFEPLRWQMGLYILEGLFAAEGRTKGDVFGYQKSGRAIRALERLSTVLAEGHKERALLNKPHLVLIDLAFYHRAMRPVLAEWTQLWLEGNQLPELTAEETIAYIQSSAPSSDAPELPPMLPRAPSLLRTRSTGRSSQIFAPRDVRHVVATVLPERYRKMLHLARDWLLSYLPHALQKINRVLFGLLSRKDLERALKDDPSMPPSRAKLAVPFVGKDMPSRGSEYAHPDVTISLTALAYRYEGLRWTDFVELISSLRQNLTQELGPYSERKSNVLYTEWILRAGGRVRGVHHEGQDNALQRSASEGSEREEMVPLRMLRMTDLAQLKKLFTLFRFSPLAIQHYLLNFVFPAYMQHQVLKVSSSGQDLGGDMLFAQRVGFSGTPSSLLPRELGTCDYERGANGLVLHTLSDPNVVSVSELPDNWSVDSLLRLVAQSTSPQFHALIDSGALVTGRSNRDVAAFLLKNGLQDMEGVVFLDDTDQQVILVRATGRVMNLAQCGIRKEKRFSFYDQVHTTGVDIDQTYDAVAAQTLGKDMTYRDYSQGAYRMRGIGTGQRIVLLVIPGLQGLIARECNAAKPVKANMKSLQESLHPEAEKPVETPGLLTNINAWLVVNSMQAEAVQSNQLAMQNLANVWRKNAFSKILSYQLRVVSDEIKQRATEVEAESDDDEIVSTCSSTTTKKELSACLDVFHEPIDFSIRTAPPEAVALSTTIAKAIAQQSPFIKKEEQSICQGILDSVSQLVARAVRSKSDVERLSADAPPLLKRQLSSEPGVLQDHAQDDALNVEMVQARVQEREQEKEMATEKEIEIEKYVDLAYRRDAEAATPWDVRTLAAAPQANGGVFYPLSKFAPAGHTPLRLPEYVHASNNYFSLAWTSHRRIKNAIMVMDWIPSQAALQETVLTGGPMSPQKMACLESALDWFSDPKSKQALMSRAAVRKLLRAHIGAPPTALQLSAMMGDQAMISVETLREKLTQGALWNSQSGRHFVVLSLAEAETLRRILHVRADAGEPLLPNNDCSVALRNVTSENFEVVDASGSWTPSAPLDGLSCLDLGAHQTVRFVDSMMYYKDDELMSLLRALQVNSPEQRRSFFGNVMSCRRRLRRKFVETPIERALVAEHEWDLLRLAALVERVRRLVAFRGLQPSTAFHLFNVTRNGILTSAELWGGLYYLGLTELKATDVLGLMSAFDSNRDGALSESEFVLALREMEEVTEPTPEPEEGEDEVEPPKPRGQAELAQAVTERAAKERAAEEITKLQETKQAKEEAFRSMRARLEEALMGGPNPRTSKRHGYIYFSFQYTIPPSVQCLGGATLVMDGQEQEISKPVETKESNANEPRGSTLSDLLKSLEESAESFPETQNGEEADGDAKEEQTEPVEPENATEPTIEEPTEVATAAFDETMQASSEIAVDGNEETKESPSEVHELEETKPEEGEAIAATNGCYVVQRLRRQHHLSLPVGAELKLQIPFVKNGDGPSIGLYTMSFSLRLREMPQTPSPIFRVAGSDEPLLFVSPFGTVVDKDGLDDLNRGYGFDEEAVARDSARMRPNTWHIVSITVNSQSRKMSHYVDGALCKPSYRRYNATEPWSVAGGVSIMGLAGLTLKSAHFLLRPLSNEIEIAALAEQLFPPLPWVCVLCDFHNSAHETRCKRCTESRTRSRGTEWKCDHCGLYQAFSIACLKCGQRNYSRKGGFRTCPTCKRRGPQNERCMVCQAQMRQH